MSDFYCAKCRKRTEAKDVKDMKAKNGRHMKQGHCTTCNTKVCRFVAAPKAEAK